MAIEQDDDVAVVRLHRPPVNSLTLDAVAELCAAFDSLAEQRPAGLVLTGDGTSFCAGLDVKALANYSTAEQDELINRINAMILALYGFPGATVAAVNGHALGAGAVLLLACDTRIAVSAEGVKIGLTEVTAGVSYPAGPMEVVKAELEPSARRSLVLTGAVLTPAEALVQRVLDELAAPVDLLGSAVRCARDRGRAPAYAAVKAQLRGETLERMREIASDRDHDARLTS